MKDTLANKFSSFDATVAVADDPQDKPIWLNQPPLAFQEGLTAVRPAIAALATAGAEQSIPTTGSIEAMRGLRIQFETTLLPLARAVFQCLKAQGRTEDAAKADLTATDLHNARAGALAGFGETVLDLADPLTHAPATGQPVPGDKYGVTAAKIAPVDALWEQYSTAVGAPQGARAKRKAKTNALPGQFAAVEEQFTALDDLILQFNGTPAGQQFVDTWFNARHVAALGHRTAHPTPPAPPAPPHP